MIPDTRGDETYWSLRLSRDALLKGQGDGEKPEQTQTWDVSYSPDLGVLYQARYGKHAFTFVFILIFLPRLSLHVSSDNWRIVPKL